MSAGVAGALVLFATLAVGQSASLAAQGERVFNDQGCYGCHTKVDGSVLANLRSAGYPGRVIRVNVSGDTVQGSKAYRSLLGANGEVDLAVIALPAAGVISAGFRCWLRSQRCQRSVSYYRQWALGSRQCSEIYPEPE